MPKSKRKRGTPNPLGSIQAKIKLMLAYNSTQGIQPASQSELAVAAGVTQPTASRWISGVRDPHPRQIPYIAKALNVSVAWLTDQDAGFPPMEADAWVEPSLSHLPPTAQAFWTRVLNNRNLELIARRAAQEVIDQEP